MGGAGVPTAFPGYAYADTLYCVVTAIFDPLTLNVCMRWMWRDQTLYRILAQSNSSRLSYGDLKTENFAADPTSAFRRVPGLVVGCSCIIIYIRFPLYLLLLRYY